MDLYRAFLAVAISFVILLGYQYLFVKPALQRQQSAVREQVLPETQKTTATHQAEIARPALNDGMQTTQPVAVRAEARSITIDTPLYTAVINEQGGGYSSFELKNYREELKDSSGPMQLVMTKQPQELPVLFSLDNGGSIIPLFVADQEKVTLSAGKQSQKLELKAGLDNGLNVTRILTFHADSYLIDDVYQVTNSSEQPIQISPAITLINEPFSHVHASQRFLFAGPAAYTGGELIETKPKELEKGPESTHGEISWAGFVSNYFMTAVVPKLENQTTVTFSLAGGEERIRTVLAGGISSIPPQQSVAFRYSHYFGPKKLKILQANGSDLAKAVNFGWFDVLAKPMLWLLNFFYSFAGNYGVAIILVTVLIKAVFWPITQKGMKSMKNMQKLQPKMAKLREKYKDDPAKMNQEMMTMYKTYKVNPLGGCLPMLIQIPFFFALYRVLMAAIELRHAPFMFWINDLSAPDRLWLGFDIPYLHGLPVLTLLMGASMYLQQKMTPTVADPTQAKIMQFLPVIFTFMFLNFASGLVLYWFVNNLLSILQQQLINRQAKVPSGEER
ncbi:MAG: membrane protein insertase YidC [Desulfobulbus propionicus]|nr:MAG: membrane protein insertase YidC [Desulfobulbus propionicus]